jgi:hypothetical protein
VPYTLFVLVLVPVYWQDKGPENFLWGCDLALLFTCYALWSECRLLYSMMALAILIPELIWIVDFCLRLIAGVDALSLGLTSYMFESATPLYIRGLSLFHLFLPMVLLWCVYQAGYDRRALWYQTGLAWMVLPLTWWLTEPARNINWVYGIASAPQDWMPGLAYLLLVMSLVPILIYWPTHLVLRRWFNGNGRSATGGRQ